MPAYQPSPDLEFLPLQLHYFTLASPLVNILLDATLCEEQKMSNTTYKAAILDDYQGIANKYADFENLPPSVVVTIFQDHIPEDKEAALVERLLPYDIIACMRERTPFPKTLLEKLPKLKLLITTGGVNASIDASACKELDIAYSGTGYGGNIYATAEVTWALILALAKNLIIESENVAKGKWQTSVGLDLHGMTFGLIGLGRIGRMMIPVAKAFGMDIIAWSTNMTPEFAKELGVEYVPSLKELLQRSRIASVHLKLSERSRGLIGLEELRALGPDSYIVNTSRGPIIQEPALIEALKQKLIAGAGLDVFDVEPLPENHPLRSLKNVALTPHIGYGSDRSYQTFFHDIRENILEFVESGKVLRNIQ